VAARRTLETSTVLARSVVVAVAALILLSGCSKTDGEAVAGTTVDETTSVSSTQNSQGSVPTSTAPTTTVPTSTAPTTTTPTTAPATDLPVPQGYPISFPPGGDVTNVTEEIESTSGADLLVTRVEIWYDGDRFEEFALFYLNWIVDNGYFIADSLTNEEDKNVIIRGIMFPENDTYGLTVAVVGDFTTVATLWGRPPE